ncbi:MAG: carbohydrate kinase, partial [Planctomycetota bacterium]
MATSESYQRIIQSFQKRKIGLIGDIVADRFVYGVPARLSREAPVLIIEYEGEELFPGCAGNTIRNLEDLGAIVYPVSVLGDDQWGQKLLQIFQKGRVVTDFIYLVPDQRTVTKTRFM